MRGCLLKCSSEQVRKATDAEWFGAELSRTLATELFNSRRRSGQRGYVDVETEGQPSEEPSTDTTPNVQQVLGVGVPVVSSPLTTICEEAEVVDPVVSQPMETESTTRPRQPEMEPGSELVERNVR